jgi:hypothetical protein
VSAFEIRPRTPTEIVDAAFELLRRDYVTLITITAAIQLPLLAIQVVLGVDVTNPLRLAENMGSFLVLNLLYGIAMSLSDGAIIYAVSETLLGHPASVSRALGRMLARGVPLVVSGIVRNLAAGIAMIALVVPGIYVWCRYAAVPAVAVLEDRGTNASVDRAWRLGEDRVWPNFLALFLGFLIYLALAFVLGFGVQLLGAVMPLFTRPSIVMVVQRLPGVFFYPIISVITTLIYYDVRVRKEAFDLEMMAKELGAPSAGA